MWKDHFKVNYGYGFAVEERPDGKVVGPVNPALALFVSQRISRIGACGFNSMEADGQESYSKGQGAGD